MNTTKTIGYAVTATGIRDLRHAPKRAAMACARDMKLESDSREGARIDVYRHWYDAAFDYTGREHLAAWCVIGCLVCDRRQASPRFLLIHYPPAATVAPRTTAAFRVSRTHSLSD